jgi:hypothetical protein
VGKAIRVNEDYINSLIDNFELQNNEFKNFTPPEIEERLLSSSPAVKRITVLSALAHENSLQSYDTTLESLKKQLVIAKKEYLDWEVGFEPIKKSYEEVIRSDGGSLMSLHQSRKVLVESITASKQEALVHKRKSEQTSNISTKRMSVLEELEGSRNKYFKKRKDKCDFFTSNSGKSIKVTVQENEDTSAFENNLKSFKRGSYPKDEEIKLISQRISPREFVDSILRYEWSERKNPRLLEPIVDKTELEKERVKILVEFLLNTYPYKDLLGIVYTSTPEDVPKIEYLVGSDYKKLDELSVGQKATALLLIALSDGNFPVVIDQPEDSLDLKSIWEDVCGKIRSSKDQRQFIFTTHNSSVAVASDSDKFTILEAGATRSKVLHSGSLNHGEVAKEVIDYLEGGRGPYLKKRRKYNI